MRNDPLKYAIVVGLSLLLGGAETLAASATPSMRDGGASDRAGATITGRIAPGTTASHLVAFERGREYRVRVTAASRSAGIDLQLTSPSGRELDRDTSTASMTEVAIVPSGRGHYEVDVTMARCPTSKCAYQLVVLSR
jgi:hypothetical protein